MHIDHFFALRAHQNLLLQTARVLGRRHSALTRFRQAIENMHTEIVNGTATRHG
ncbi:MAG: hypothetical protein NVSMB2_28110 [Chloroflexota bacterium]